MGCGGSKQLANADVPGEHPAAQSQAATASHHEEKPQVAAAAEAPAEAPQQGSTISVEDVVAHVEQVVAHVAEAISAEPEQQVEVQEESKPAAAEVAAAVEEAPVAAAVAAEEPVEEEPAIYMGYLTKRGHFVRNWKRRYFVLDAGVLKYYSKSLEAAPYGEDLKGVVMVSGASVERKDQRITLHFAADSKRDLLVEAETSSAVESWASALTSHIAYYSKAPAKEVDQLVEEEEDETEMSMGSASDLRSSAVPAADAAVASSDASAAVASSEAAPALAVVDATAPADVDTGPSEPAASEPAATEAPAVSEPVSDATPVDAPTTAAAAVGDDDSDSDVIVVEEDAEPFAAEVEASSAEAVSTDAAAAPADDASQSGASAAAEVDKVTMFKGFMKKRGHVVKNWKRRYFVLDQGILYYYVNSIPNPPFGSDLKGSLCLESTQLKVEKKDGKIHILIPADPNKDLILSPESYQDMLNWEHELRAHIAYANKLVATGMVPSVNAKK